MALAAMHFVAYGGLLNNRVRLGYQRAARKSFQVINLKKDDVIAASSCSPAGNTISSQSLSSCVTRGRVGGGFVGSREGQSWVCTATGGGEGGNVGGSGDGNGGGGGNEDSSWESSGDSGDNGDDELLNLQQAEEMAAAKGSTLPEDFIQAANNGGLRRAVLESYLSIATGGLLTGFLARTLPAFRDRLIADKMFFFKILAEVGIDSGCATVAELRKRGDDFWGEFEFYLSDLMVGLVMDVVLVSLIAPVAVIGRQPKSAGATGLKKWLGGLPSAVFEKSGVRKYSVADRASCLVVKGLEYSLGGLTCGLIGQSIANSLMTLRRKYSGTSEHDVPIPPLFRTALVWGAFMGLSSNVRYQIVFGLERIVDMTIARKIPQVAYGSTVAIRFVNNVIGGENFIDMARWAGIQ